MRVSLTKNGLLVLLSRHLLVQMPAEQCQGILGLVEISSLASTGGILLTGMIIELENQLDVAIPHDVDYMHHQNC